MFNSGIYKIRVFDLRWYVSSEYSDIKSMNVLELCSFPFYIGEQKGIPAYYSFMGKTASERIPDVSWNISSVRVSEKRVPKGAFVPKGQDVPGERRNRKEEAHNLQI